MDNEKRLDHETSYLAKDKEFLKDISFDLNDANLSGSYMNVITDLCSFLPEDEKDELAQSRVKFYNNRLMGLFKEIADRMDSN